MADPKSLEAWAGGSSEAEPEFSEEKADAEERAIELFEMLADNPDAVVAGTSGKPVDPELLDKIEEMLMGLSSDDIATIADALFFGGADRDPGSVPDVRPADTRKWLEKLAGVS